MENVEKPVSRAKSVQKVDVQKLVHQAKKYVIALALIHKMMQQIAEVVVMLAVLVRSVKKVSVLVPQKVQPFVLVSVSPHKAIPKIAVAVTLSALSVKSAKMVCVKTALELSHSVMDYVSIPTQITLIVAHVTQIVPIANSVSKEFVHSNAFLDTLLAQDKIIKNNVSPSKITQNIVVLAEMFVLKDNIAKMVNALVLQD